MKESIEEQLKKMSDYIKSDYQFDNVDIILERTRVLLNYQADIPGLIKHSQSIKSECELKHINDKPALRKILCSVEYSLVEEVKNMQKALSQASRTTQSQLATLRTELDANIKSRS